VDLLDTNDDGRLNIADGIPLLRHLFMSGPPLQPPFETCGPDPTADAFACVESNCAP
jgi:hypothetical protein